MNRKDIIEQMLKDKDLAKSTKKEIDQFISIFLETIKKSIKKGEDVTLVGFGTFTKIKKAPRLGVNPSTGERIKIRGRVIPKFRPGKTWKEML